jgi:hypothetical protein
VSLTTELCISDEPATRSGPSPAFCVESIAAFDTSTQPPPTEMLRMVVAPFQSCRKMHSLKTSQHDYQTASCEVMMA